MSLAVRLGTAVALSAAHVRIEDILDARATTRFEEKQRKS
jgi:hypothetical protein